MAQDRNRKDAGNGRSGSPLRWAPALLGLGGAAALAVGNQPLHLPSQPTEVRSTAPVVYGPPAPERPRIYGPPVPAEVLLARSAAQAVAGGVSGKPRKLPGGLGPIGPVQGPLSVELAPSGPVVGPSWNRNPLPMLPNLSLPVGVEPRTRSTDTPAMASVPSTPKGVAGQKGADSSSVIPDAAVLAVSQKANPTLEVRDRVARAAETTAEKPISVNLELGDASEPRAAGGIVAVRMNASAAGYFVLLRIDAAGKVSTVFRSVRPAQRVACVLRAGTQPGAEYLVALATVNPPNGEDVAAALKGAPMSLAMPAGASGGLQPGPAWAAVVQYAPGVAGPSDPIAWQKHQWAVSTASFVTRAQVEPAKRDEKGRDEKPSMSIAAKGAPAKPPAGKPSRSDGAPSQLPDLKPTPNKPAESKSPDFKAPQPADSSALPQALPDGDAAGKGDEKR